MMILQEIFFTLNTVISNPRISLFPIANRSFLSLLYLFNRVAKTLKDHLKTLDFLRGIAALGVVLFHFSGTALPTISFNVLTGVLSYGHCGVQLFFVISGFIIPYSMSKGGYQLSDYTKNLLKRFIRICPPSYFAILLTIALNTASILVHGRPVQGSNWPGINFISVLGNLTYTVPYFNTSWFNGVFWTLNIEFQFYLLIGVLMSLLKKNNVIKIYILLLLILALWVVPIQSFFSYGSFFVLGIILFLKKERLITTPHLIILSFVTILTCFFQNDFPEFIAGLIAFLMILSNYVIDFKFTNFLGKISYSLYITHSSVGAGLEIILKRVTSLHEYPGGKIVLLFIYSASAVLFATLFYKYIENPFIHYSKQITLSGKKQPA